MMLMIESGAYFTFLLHTEYKAVRVGRKLNPAVLMLNDEQAYCTTNLRSLLFFEMELEND